jgi:hypothetical protein
MPDAVIVPATRSDGGRVAHAAGVARIAGCPLVVMCSRGVAATAVGASLADVALPHTVLIVDIEARRSPGMKPLLTDRVRVATRGRGDTSFKRNLGLLAAQMLGWERLLFLDDDVHGLREQELRNGMSLLSGEAVSGRVEAIGWTFGDFPDNSVVCHSRRDAGLEQETFIGAGGLLVSRQSPDGLIASNFFPKVYNEDWLFLFDSVARRRVVLAGELHQAEYDPYDTPERASHQEFGDILAEGLYRLIHESAQADISNEAEWVEELLTPAKDERWWRQEISSRRSMLVQIRRQLPDHHRSRSAILSSLHHADEAINDSWSVELADYVTAWRTDLKIWRDMLPDLPSTFNGQCDALAQVLEVLGQVRVTEYRVVGSRRPTGRRLLASAWRVQQHDAWSI